MWPGGRVRLETETAGKAAASDSAIPHLSTSSDGRQHETRLRKVFAKQRHFHLLYAGEPSAFPFEVATNHVDLGERVEHRLGKEAAEERQVTIRIRRIGEAGRLDRG